MRLQDYWCHAIEHPASSPIHDGSSGTYYPLSKCISYDNFSPTYRAFLAAITSGDEPSHFFQAIRNPKGREAMKAEIVALEANNTWEFTTLPLDKKALGCK